MDDNQIRNEFFTVLHSDIAEEDEFYHKLSGETP